MVQLGVTLVNSGNLRWIEKRKFENELENIEQYIGRSYILIRNVKIMDNDCKDEHKKKIEVTVKDLISKKLRLQECAAMIDKLHQVGKKEVAQ